MKAIFLSLLFLVGVASAAPISADKATQRNQYASSLNTMAATVMSWYGGLLFEDNDHNNASGQPFFATQWMTESRRSFYPKQIQRIEILSTDVIKGRGQYEYKFKAKALIQYQTDAGVHWQTLHDEFIFEVPLLAQAILKTLKTRLSDDAKRPPAQQYVQAHYRVREFAYAWLAYLDGVDAMKSVIHHKQWQSGVQYSTKIGAISQTGNLTQTLLKRRLSLEKGGHLLRDLSVKTQGDDDKQMIELTMEWEGVNAQGKPVIAKILQQIKYQFTDDGIELISINERHLLPDIAPWTGLLC